MRRRIVATYDYIDALGALLFQVVRYDPKDFRQRRPDGRGGWDWTVPPEARVLYRLPAVLAQARAGRGVYVVDGEKDVHSVERAGAVATCNPGGALKWRDNYSESLRGAHVRIVCDRDEPNPRTGAQPGYDHAAQVARSLDGIARSVAILEPVVGKDVTDHLAAGHSLNKLVDVTDMVRARVPPEPVRVTEPLRIARTPSSEFEERVDLLRQIDLRAVFEALTGVHVPPSGKVRCVFHDERTPSLVVRERYYRCFGCDARGDVLVLGGELSGIGPKPKGPDFGRLVEWIEDRLLVRAVA